MNSKFLNHDIKAVPKQPKFLKNTHTIPRWLTTCSFFDPAAEYLLFFKYLLSYSVYYNVMMTKNINFHSSTDYVYAVVMTKNIKINSRTTFTSTFTVTMTKKYIKFNFGTTITTPSSPQKKRSSPYCITLLRHGDE